jgi:hypothetical protein
MALNSFARFCNSNDGANHLDDPHPDVSFALAVPTCDGVPQATGDQVLKK